MIFITVILPVSQVQTQQLITSQIRSHREYNTNLHVQGGPKKVSHHQFFKILYWRLPTRLDFFIKLKY